MLTIYFCVWSNPLEQSQPSRGHTLKKNDSSFPRSDELSRVPQLSVVDHSQVAGILETPKSMQALATALSCSQECDSMTLFLMALYLGHETEKSNL